MTAHAMFGDRAKCLESGMNDYVSKPIDRKKLFTALRKNIHKHKRENPPYEIENSPFKIPKLPGLNIEEGLERLGGVWSLYVDILEVFCISQEKFGREFRSLIEKKDFESARVKIHGFKGAAGNVSATDLSTAAKALEDACKSENKDQILNILPLVEVSFAQVVASFEKLSVLPEIGEDIPQPSETDIAPPDSSNFFELTEKLDKSLLNADPVESEYWLREINACLSSDPSDKKELECLIQQVSDYNFDDARAVLSRFKQKRMKE